MTKTTTAEKIPCPRGCGAKFCRQPTKSAIVLHPCPNNRSGKRYADNNPRDIEVRVGGDNAGTEVREQP